MEYICYLLHVYKFYLGNTRPTQVVQKRIRRHHFISSIQAFT